MVKLGTFDFPRLISFALTYLKIFSSPINFDNAFVAFMESAAMYLRFVKIKLWGQRKFFWSHRVFTGIHPMLWKP